MASTQIDIWNQALSNIGSKVFIQNPNERSVEASVLAIWWKSAVEFVLAAHPWPFATAYQLLAPLDDNPTGGDWLYVYRYPSDCIHARRLVTKAGRRDPNPPPFKIGSDNEGRVIYTDQENALLEYTKEVTEPERFDPNFVDCLAWYLGHKAAPSVSRMPNMTDFALKQYKVALTNAADKAMNESQQDDPQEAENIRARD